MIVSRHWDPPRPQTHRVGMFFALASIMMLFAGLTSAYIVRHGLGGNWSASPMPPQLWVNTALLVASSITLERARRTGPLWLKVTLALGLLFVAGQLAVWQMLSAQGIYLSSNAHSSFFYMLTGLHGLHLLGGIVAIAYVAFLVRGPQSSRWMEATAIYWHFMGALWLYLVALLFVWN